MHRAIIVLLVWTLSTALSVVRAQEYRLLPADIAEAVAEYTEPTPTAVRRLLDKLGADDSVFPSGFAGLSALQQIQWAYASVESADPGRGSEFVGALVTLVALDKPSILMDPYVYGYAGNDNVQFQFAVLSSSTPAVAMDPSVSRVIAIVSDVIASRGSMFSALSIMERRLGLDKDAIVRAMLRFNSGKEALADRLARLSNPPQKKVLAELALEILMTIPSSRTDIRLAEAAFRWIGDGDPKYGLWFETRESMIEDCAKGCFEVQTASNKAREVTKRLRKSAATMVLEFISHGRVPTAKDVEFMYNKYIQHDTELAALWSVAVWATHPADPTSPRSAFELYARESGLGNTQEAGLYDATRLSELRSSLYKCCETVERAPPAATRATPYRYIVPKEVRQAGRR